LKPQVIDSVLTPFIILTLLLIALLEHHISPNADVAAKIFELGLRFFSTDVDYVVRYLNFLINKCDEASKYVRSRQL
jgi:hypothetical protein